jgi:hypothetical protein
MALLEAQENDDSVLAVTHDDARVLIHVARGRDLVLAAGERVVYKHVDHLVAP